MQYDGHYVAVPVNIHRTDMIWANPELLASVGATEVPKSWDEFNTVAEKLQSKGVIPLAIGGQPWQETILFENVVLGIGGTDFYQKALIDLDEDALKSDTMKKVFDQMRTLRGFVDADFSGRDWNLATAMVMNGKAAMQIMGDWAKGEFLAAGKEPGKDFLCEATPSNDGYLFNTDSFAMFDVSGDDKIAGQKLLAELIVGEKFQETFNLLKGSIPARLGVPMDDFDECALQSEKDMQASQVSDGFLSIQLRHISIQTWHQKVLSPSCLKISTLHATKTGRTRCMSASMRVQRVISIFQQHRISDLSYKKNLITW